MASQEDFLSYYAPVCFRDGSIVKLYFQKYSGEICEGTWEKSSGEWSFQDRIEAGHAVSNTPLSAIIVDDDQVRLFYVGEGNIIKEAPNGTFDDLNAEIYQGGHLSAAKSYWGKTEKYRLYHATSEGSILKSYGGSETKWNQPGSIRLPNGFETAFGSPISVINTNPPDWYSPALHVFYRNTDDEIKEMVWTEKTDWRMNDPEIAAGPESRISATCTETERDSNGNITSEPLIMLTWTQDDLVYANAKEGDDEWLGVDQISVDPERAGTHLAIVSAANSNGADDVHLFTSGENGRIVHRIREDGKWIRKIVSPPGTETSVMKQRLVLGPERRVPVLESLEPDMHEALTVADYLDEGVFNNSMRADGLALTELDPPKLPEGARGHWQVLERFEHSAMVCFNPGKKGHFDQVVLDMKSYYGGILRKLSSLLDILLFEPSTPTDFPVEKKRTLFEFTDTKDGFPPHLQLIPLARSDSLTSIFDAIRIIPILELFTLTIPGELVDGPFGTPWSEFGNDLNSLTAKNVELIKRKKGIYNEPNIGLRSDWFTDEQFAQQHLTGPNPTTIERASDIWIKAFLNKARSIGSSTTKRIVEYLTVMLKLGLQNDLYIQDYSYFRRAMNIRPGDDISMTFWDAKFHPRWGCASVVLFRLHDDGKLHPLAIVLDYKENDLEKKPGTSYWVKTTDTLEKSVTVFNAKTEPDNSAKAKAVEEKDWQWRYAKMCVQVSDWHRHEIGIHLVNTHLVEESVIVACERSFENSHPVYKLLSPHWIKTLSLNKAARSVLIPRIIKNISGMGDTQMDTFTLSSYENFNWKDLYIPNDLKRRGFPPDKIFSEKKYNNYPYAKNMMLMWGATRELIVAILKDYYDRNKKVGGPGKDPQVQHWVNEMRSEGDAQGLGARMPFFPKIKTLDELADAVTMAVHVASPQHTAVNYLQEYYQTFVPNKPSSLFQALPKTQAALKDINEQFIIKSLPFGPLVGNVWLLAAHLPHLLNMTVDPDKNIIAYAKTLVDCESRHGNATTIAAAKQFQTAVQAFEKKFQDHSKAMNVDVLPDERHPELRYDVMDPKKMAVSILI